MQQDRIRLLHFNHDYINNIVEKNFDNKNEVLKYINSVKDSEKSIALFTSKWMLKT